MTAQTPDDRAEERRAAIEAERAADAATLSADLGVVDAPLTSGDPAPPRRPRPGRNRTPSGRVGAAPKSPVLRRYDEGIEPALDSEGKPAPVPKKAKPPRIVVSRDVRPHIAAGSISGVLIEEEPTFAAGELVPVVRYQRGDDDRDDPCIVEVQSIERLRACDVTENHARAAGYRRLGQYADVHCRKVPGGPAMRLRALGRDEDWVWFAVVIPSVQMASVQFDLDGGRDADEHRCEECGSVWLVVPDVDARGFHSATSSGNPCAGSIKTTPGQRRPAVLGARWLAPAGGGDAKGYAATTKGAMTDAGVVVDSATQRRFAADGRKKTAKLSAEHSAEHKAARKAGQRAVARRKPRRATLRELREPAATTEEVGRMVGATFTPDGGAPLAPVEFVREHIGLELEPWQQEIVARAYTQDAEGNWVPRSDLEIVLIRQRPHFNEGGTYAPPEAA